MKHAQFHKLSMCVLLPGLLLTASCTPGVTAPRVTRSTTIGSEVGTGARTFLPNIAALRHDEATFGSRVSTAMAIAQTPVTASQVENAITAVSQANQAVANATNSVNQALAAEAKATQAATAAAAAAAAAGNAVTDTQLKLDAALAAASQAVQSGSTAASTAAVAQAQAAASAAQSASADAKATSAQAQAAAASAAANAASQQVTLVNAQSTAAAASAALAQTTANTANAAAIAAASQASGANATAIAAASQAAIANTNANTALARSQVSIKDFGAKGDGITDDTASIRAAIAATPEGGTLFVPAGQFKITDTILINRSINLKGGGPQSAFWPVGLSSKVAIQVGTPFPIASYSPQNCTFEDFSVQGLTGSCLNGIAFYRVYRSIIKNIHLRPGSVEHAAVVGGCLSSQFNFVMTNADYNSQQMYYANAGTWNGAGLKIEDTRTHIGFTEAHAMPTNACQFDCVVEGAGGGVLVEAQDLGGGNNTFSGTYEGFPAVGTVPGTGYCFKALAGVGFELKNCHFESSTFGVLLSGARNFSVHDCLFSFSVDASEVLRLSGCDSFSVRDCLINTLAVDDDNTRYTFEHVRGAAPTMHGASINDVQFKSFINDSDNRHQLAGMGDNGGGNLMLGGDCARPMPNELGYSGNFPTYTQTGVGLSDTTHNFYDHAYKAVCASENYMSVINVPPSRNMSNQPVTMWVDIKWLSGQPIGIGPLDGNGGGVWQQATVGPSNTGFRRVAVTIYPQAGYSGALAMRSATPGACSFYIGGYGAVLGLTAPTGIEAPMPSFQTGVQLAGRRITYGSSMPTWDAPLQGDIQFNNAPAPGLPTGWTCTASGVTYFPGTPSAPGSWRPIGFVPNSTTVSTSTVTLPASSDKVQVNFVGAVAVTLPAVSEMIGFEGKVFTVKDVSGVASVTNAISFIRGPGSTLEASPTINTPYGYLTWYLDGTVWRTK
jgi:hypothetical protein